VILAYASEAAGPHIHIHSHHDLLCGRFPRSHRRRRMPNLVERAPPSQSMQVLTTAPRFPRDLEALSHPALVTASTVTHAAAAAGTMEMALTQLELLAAKGLTGAGKAVVGAEHITAEEQMREAIRAHHQSPSLPRTR
jgi:hypothetical protein